MSLRALLYAYVFGGITFIPLVIVALIFYTAYTSVPVGQTDSARFLKQNLDELEQSNLDDKVADGDALAAATDSTTPVSDVNDVPKPRKGWLTVRRTFEETAPDGSYVGLVRGFLDARSKDPKRSRPKGTWYVVLKGKVLYLYEDESMTECEAAIELGGHDVVIYPEGLLDGELFTKRNAICLKPKVPPPDKEMPSVTKAMKLDGEDIEEKVEEKGGSESHKRKEREALQALEKKREEARDEALDPSTPWFIFVRNVAEMEDWYLALVHASDHPANSPTLAPLQAVFQPTDMSHLVSTLDEQPDVIPMRWLNALLGRLFFSYYRTHALEAYIIGRLMKKLAKVKRPSFLTDIVVREVSVGNKAPTLSKPMLKELTKEGDAALEVHLYYKGEIRITIEATATINLGARFKSYTVKLVLAAVLRELEGNLLVKVKRPPSNRIWYAFTQMPRMVLDVEPVVSDRQITWGMILSSIESRLREVIQESVVLPNMDDIAFFESSQYQHRGGIWADASRHEKASPFQTPAAPSDEERATPVSVTETAPSNEPEPSASLHRSHSSDETSTNISGVAGLPEGVPLTRPATVPGPTSPRRRSWFSRTDDTDVPPTSLDADENEETSSVSRGRSNEEEGMRSRRSSSARSGYDAQASDAESSDGSRLVQNAIPINRSVSQRSRSSSSHEDSTSSSTSTHSRSAPSESNMAAYSSQPPSTRNTPTSPTFFQTLKARDKQALSNTAKEAMRKWGVNWGSLKRDAGSSAATGSDEVPDGEHARQPEPPRAPTKPRPSYAEVRAAVEQRKEREKAASPDFGIGPGPSQAHAFPGSQNERGKDRAVSGPASMGQDGAPNAGYSGGGTLTPSRSPQDSDAAAIARSRSTSPAPRARTLSSMSNPASEAIIAPPDEVERPVLPIHTQPPQAKTMTIPGIHASHRGEVMSMGYAPPVPAPAEKKAPAIQSVYRLWKSPSAPGQAEPGTASPQPQAQPQTQNGFTGRDQDATTATPPPPPSTVPPEAQALSPPPRPTPPPLPPRSMSIPAVQAIQKHEPPRHVDENGRAISPASAALQSIVSRDRSKRASLERREEPEQEVEERPSSVLATAVMPAASPLPAAAGDGPEPRVNPHPKPPALPPRRVHAPA